MYEGARRIDQHFWLALSSALSTGWPGHSLSSVDGPKVIIEIAETSLRDVGFFIDLCERAPLVGRAIQEDITVGSLQQNTCMRLGAACPNLKGELK